MKKLIVYVKTGCPWCKGMLNLFAEKGMKEGTDYELREVLQNKAYFDELVAKSGQTKTPTIDRGGEILADTDREAVAKWLNL